MKNVYLTTLAVRIFPMSGLCSAQTPSKMTHMIVQMSGTDIPPGSFAAQPKLMWRASNSYCRIDEQADPSQGLHLRVVMNEPSSWLINLADNHAKHMIDPGPTFNCRMPIFSFNMAMAKGKIGKLEFGHELEFFQENGAKQVTGPKLSFEANYYELPLDGAVLKLVERVDIHAPILIGLVQGDKVTKVRYLLWDDQVPFKGHLFAKPTGVKIEEVK